MYTSKVLQKVFFLLKSSRGKIIAPTLNIPRHFTLDLVGQAAAIISADSLITYTITLYNLFFIEGFTLERT